MWSQADAALRDRDPELEHLRRVLDADDAAELLARALPALGITDVAAEYVRYKPHTSCLVSYRLATAAGETWAYMKAWSDDAAEKADKLRRLPERFEADAPVPSDVAAGVMVAAFPWDRKLPAAPDLGTEMAQTRLLRSLLPGWDVANLQVVGLRYKPERRYVARVDGPDGPVAILKCYDDGAFDRAVGGARAVERDPEFVTAALAGVARRRRVTLGEWLPGEGLDGLIRAGRDPLDVYPKVGAELAALHSSEPLGWPRRDSYEVPESIHAAVRTIGTVLPQLVGPAQQVADRCVAGLDWAAQGSAIHGDFSADQVLVDGGTPTLIDFDRATVGLPVEDLGRFVANLWAAEVGGVLSAAQAAERGQAFLDGYADAAAVGVDGPELAGLGVATAAALLQLAQEPFRRRDPAWDEQTQALVERAAQAVASPTLGFRARDLAHGGAR